MKCKHCEDRLLEYLYGELGEEDAAAMEAHLEASEACRQEYDNLASVLETVGEAEEDGPPPAMHTRIMGYAEEAHPPRRSLWGWAFRPAVTTVMIGAITAGVYFATLRHKPPSYRDERVLTEESLVARSKPSNAPPDPEKKGHASRDDSLPRKSKQRAVPSSSGGKVDAPKEEVREQGFLAGLAEPSVDVEQGRAAPAAPESVEDTKMRMIAPPAESEEAYIAADAIDEETASPPVRMKAAAPLAEEDLFLSEKEERSPAATYGIRSAPMALKASPDGALMSEMKQTVPREISRALDLASAGKCAKAGKLVDAHAEDHPKDEACGAGWLEVARCYEEKGDNEAARETAEKALAIPGSESDARAFLDSLPPAAD